MIGDPEPDEPGSCVYVGKLLHEVPGRQRVTSWPRRARDDQGVEITIYDLDV